MSNSPIEIRPQKGPQEDFLASDADFVLFGGARGGGKSWALLMEAARHINNKNYSGVLFRRTFPQVMANGGLWETAGKMYPLLGGKASLTPVPTYTFPSGAFLRFSHMQYEKNTEDWRGSQITFIGIDEISHFTWKQVTALLACNRSTSGIAPLLRATCNPDPDSWLRKFLGWWIGDDGYPIKERAGVVRWMIVVKDEVEWGDTKEELMARFGKDMLPVSVTFIPSKLEDNQILVNADPGYKSKLMLMRDHERLQMLGGNWDAKESAGSYFQDKWFSYIVSIDENGYPVYAGADGPKRPPWTPDSIINALTEKGTRWVRYWDLASTKPHPGNPDPDYSVGALIGKQKSGRYVIADIVRFQGSPHTVEANMVATAKKDGKKIKIVLEQEPGSSGKIAGEYLVSKLSGYNARLLQKRSSKEEDWQGLSAQAEAGNVDIVTAPWNDELMKELESLGGPCRHDDQGDACSGGFNQLNNGSSYTLMHIG